MGRQRVNVAGLVIRAFHGLFRQIMGGSGGEWWMKGGRGSTKSSFISLCIVLLVVRFPFANAVIVRRYANTLRDSVYEQVCWAVSALGMERWFLCKVSPMEIVYLPTGQRILFRGLDDPLKLKSTKFRRGYCAILWFEELDQVAGWAAVSSVVKSLRRGGDAFWTFYSYNPPRSLLCWVNDKAIEMERKPGCTVHHSTYLDVIESGHADWLGPDFIADAEWQMEADPKGYEWEMLGIPTGNGGNVFDIGERVHFREVTDEETARFDNLRCGQDFGWYPDPWAFTISEWQPAQRRIVTWYEDGGNKLQPDEQARRVMDALTWPDTVGSPAVYHHLPVHSDDADPQAIASQRDTGANARAAGKGNMRMASYRFLQSCEWVIDPARCPRLAREVREMQYEQNADGEWLNSIPDGNDHWVDSVRYAFMGIARTRWAFRRQRGDDGAGT